MCSCPKLLSPSLPPSLYGRKGLERRAGQGHLHCHLRPLLAALIPTVHLLPSVVVVLRSCRYFAFAQPITAYSKEMGPSSMHFAAAGYYVVVRAAAADFEEDCSALISRSALNFEKVRMWFSLIKGPRDQHFLYGIGALT